LDHPSIPEGVGRANESTHNNRVEGEDSKEVAIAAMELEAERTGPPELTIFGRLRT
jgi:hypothetical protein